MAYNPVNPNGQATSANSAPVVVASDQSAIKIKVYDGSGNIINSTSSALNVSTQSGSTTAVTQATASNLNATVVPSNSTAAAIPSVAQPIGTNAVSADPTATTSTYNTIPLSDLLGKLVTVPYAIPQNWYSGTASATGLSSTSLIPAISGYKLGLTQITIVNTGSTTTFVNLQDGNSGTTKYVAPAPAGGGSVITLPTPVYNTSGNAWYFAAGIANSTIYVSATAFASKN